MVNRQQKIIITLGLFIIAIGIVTYFFLLDGDLKSTMNTLNVPSKEKKTTEVTVQDSLVQALTFVIFKKDQQLELWTEGDSGWSRTGTYNITLVNASVGVRLYSDESILPEGIYATFLDTLGHLQLKFPNEMDSIKAVADLRAIPRANIVFSDQTCINCITVTEDVLSVIQKHIPPPPTYSIQVIIAPYDFRKPAEQLTECTHCPHWIMELYAHLALALEQFK